MQVQLWNAAWATRSPSPLAGRTCCAQVLAPATQTDPGRAWLAASHPSLGPQEPEVRNRRPRPSSNSGQEDHPDPALNLRVKKEVGSRGGPKQGTSSQGRTAPRTPPSLPCSPSTLTLRSVLRIQMKVQTRGLLDDLSTMKPPGPFSPLRREVQLGRC